MTVRKLLVGVAALTVLVTIGGAGTAAADVSSATPTDTPSAVMVAESSDAGTAALPSGCIGYSDVYKTGTDGGRANGSGIIDCEYAYSRLYAETSLYRDRWYGPEFLDSDSSTANSSDWVASISIWRCAGAGTYTYRSYAYHEATAGSARYTANTSDSARFAC